jgi:hypothetical protein
MARPTKQEHNEKLNLIRKALNEAHGNLKQASKISKIEYNIIQKWVSKYNLQFVSKIKPISSKEKIQESYSRLQSLNLVAKELGGTAQGIRQAMIRYGLPINKLLRNMCNDDFFTQETETTFYWAGFIAADGCVKKDKRYNGSYKLAIQLAINDILHLEKFKNDINFEGKMYYRTKKYKKYNDSHQVSIEITSKKIFDDLAKFNIIPNKTKIYTFPEWLINHPFVHHFMRGYFDGDGSIYMNSSSKQLNITLCGTKKFLLIYRNILEQKCSLNYRNKDIPQRRNIGILTYGGNNKVPNIMSFLYKDATIYLERKKDIYDQFKQ